MNNFVATHQQKLTNVTKILQVCPTPHSSSEWETSQSFTATLPLGNASRKWKLITLTADFLILVCGYINLHLHLHAVGLSSFFLNCTPQWSSSWWSDHEKLRPDFLCVHTLLYGVHTLAPDSCTFLPFFVVVLVFSWNFQVRGLSSPSWTMQGLCEQTFRCF